MRGLFQKKVKDLRVEPAKEKFAKAIADFIVRWQLRVSRWLCQIDLQMRAGVKKVLLICIGLVWASYCLLILWEAVSNKKYEKAGKLMEIQKEAGSSLPELLDKSKKQK
jgi:hypothetical protein